MQLFFSTSLGQELYLGVIAHYLALKKFTVREYFELLLY